MGLERQTHFMLVLVKRALKKLLIGTCIITLLVPQLQINAKEQNRAQSVRAAYEKYIARLESVAYRQEISEKGFEIVESQIFPFEPKMGLVTESDAEPEQEYLSGMSLIPAFDRTYHRLALFLADVDGRILYRTDQLETNNQILGQMTQPEQEIASIAFQDLNGDMQTDIILITYCDKKYKVGDVLFQSADKNTLNFYRDYRISEKLNRFGMNKNTKAITAFVRDGYSTEFLYTALTLKQLRSHGFQVITEQCYTRTFGKLGKLQVVPGTYQIADYDVFLIYLVN